MSESRPLQFYFRGHLVQVADLPVTTTVLEWLRVHQQQCGSKEGCAEGDCGACTVIIAERDDNANNGLTLRPINACIHLLGMLDGKALLTVEDLAPDETLLHPVQQAMVDCHGSQCGFCTPGFVMSLYALYEQHESAPSRDTISDALSGNLCRCTGYRPIVDAAARAFDHPRRSLDLAGIRQQLDTLAELPTLTLHYGEDRFFVPRSLNELAEYYLRYPDAQLVAGATDVGLWITKQGRQLGKVIHINQVNELRQSHRDGDSLTIGAAVPLSEAWSALVDWEPGLTEVARRFASPPVRNAGTLGGNIANGSPIGDSMPPLLALGAILRLQKGNSVREVPLDTFYTGYQSNIMESGEFIREIILPAPQTIGQRRFACYKLAKRFDQDISAVCGAFALQVDTNGLIREARIAFGGMAATPQRAPYCEAALLGRHWNEDTLLAAMQALPKDYSPLTDLRASAAYRQTAATGLLQRYWLEYSSSSSYLHLNELMPIEVPA